MRLSEHTRKLLAYILMFLVLVLCLVALLQSLVGLRSAPIANDQDAESIIIQYRALEPFVAEQDEVGFIQNLTGRDASIYTYLLQYTLTPTLVIPGWDCCALVVAYSDESESPLEIPEGFRIARDFGNGLYLLGRE